MKDFTEIRAKLPEIMSEYAPDIMEDDDRVNSLKEAISRLQEPERETIILYSELKSVRDLGTAMGVSYRTAARKVNRIRASIFQMLKQSA